MLVLSYGLVFYQCASYRYLGSMREREIVNIIIKGCHMKTKLNKLNPLFLATAVALGGAAVPTIASAGASASVGVANMYLWRGQNLTPDGAQVHGGIDYSSDMGLYGGVWTTTETGGHETDLYVGFGGEVGGFSYDLSYWWYLYPEERDEDTSETIGISDSDAAEFIVSLGFAGVSLGAYINADSDNDDNNYFTLGYSFDKYGITYGMWDLEFPDAGGDEYTHLTFTYSATDEVTLGVSKAFSDLDDDTGVEEDPLFYVAYDLSFDLQ